MLFKVPSRMSARLTLNSFHLSKANFSSVQTGSKYSPSFKNYLVLPNGEIGSYFHDIPIDFDKTSKTCNVIIEIPRWTNAKFEINTETPFNPITQDIKENNPRFVKNLFPFKGYIQNYGAIPQTWDDPTITEPETGFKGDNDPIDVVEIGSKVAKTGDVLKAKILGSLALIDDGELDWKVIAIDVNDELSSQLKDIEDVKRLCPGLLDAVRTWFKDYKIPDGKPENEFGFKGQYLNASKTVSVIEHSHESWKKLISGVLEGKKIPLIQNSTNVGTQGFTTSTSVNDVTNGLSAGKDTPIPSEIDKVYYA